MADKVLNIKIAASAVGVDGAVRDVNALAAAVRKAQSSAGGGGRGGGGGFFQSLNRQAQGLGLAGESSIFGLLKGAGALAGVAALGQLAQNATEAVRSYRDILRFGGTKTEAFASVVAETIPVVGDTAKSFRGLIDELDGSAEALRQLDIEREFRQAIAQTASRRDTRRSNVLFNLGEDSRKAGEADELTKLFDAFRQQRQQIESEFKEGQIARDRRRARELANLAPADQEAAKNKFDHLDQVAQRERDRKISDVDVAARAADIAQQREIADLERARADRRRARERARGDFRADLLGDSADTLGQIPGRQLDAERARIREQFARKDLALQQALSNPESLLSAAEKRLLGQLREQLPASQREALSNVREDLQTAGRPNLESSRFLTGAGNELENKRIEKNTAESLKYLKLMYEFLRSRAASGNAGGIPLFDD